MNNVETYTLTVNDAGQKVCISQSDPNKRFILDGTALVQELNTTSSSTVQADNNMIESSNLATLLDPPQLEMISLDNTQDLEEQLIHELDSDMLNASDPDSYFQMLHMDIREPLSKLKKLLEHKLNMKLTNFVFTLQDTQSLEDHKNLVDQCVQGEGIVQVNVQVQYLAKKINIVDVLKPAKDYIHNENNVTQEVQSDEDDVQVTEPASKDDAEEMCSGEPQNIVQWQVDLQYKKEQERLKIPLDPEDWSVLHVRHWLQWAVRQFSLSNIKLSDWNMTGKELFKVTMKDFQKLVPNDPEDIFWTHLELLRKMKLIATLRNDPQKEAQRKELHKPKLKVFPNYASAINPYKSPYIQSSSGNKTGNNGQIQLWQFLLELLTSRAHTSVIQWTGREGEFKLTHPEVVAHLWGERKNKPAMNYEKLSRALRYYYDGDMISKVHGKRFVYKFVCDLKYLLGYSAKELANLVKYGNPMIEIKD